MLWAFDMELTTDPATGKPIIPDTNVKTGFAEGLVLSVKEFPVNLKVRSAVRRKAIEEGYEAVCADVFTKYDDIGNSSTF